jgi:hypothetical protein
MTYSPGCTAGLAHRGSEKSPLNLHLEFSIGTHKLEVVLKTWESMMDTGKVPAVKEVLITLGNTKK